MKQKEIRLVGTEKGQTMVEYILLIAVVVVIGNSVFAKLDEYMISNPDSFQNTYLKGFRSTFSGGSSSSGNEFTRFLIRK